MRLKVGDTFPNPAADLNADLAGATVSFRMRRLDGTPFIDRLAVVDDASQGLVHYAWEAGDTNTAGAYRCDFRVEYAGGEIQRFPQGSYLEVVIRP
jgi:hypothetical protein